MIFTFSSASLFLPSLFWFHFNRTKSGALRLWRIPWVLLTLVFLSSVALFTVESEQNSYNGELHDKITMGCRFSSIPSVSDISVIWKRISPLPSVDLYQLDKGRENPSAISTQFQSRVRLLREELKKFRAVIELSQLRLNDSGTYQCIVIHASEDDYKQTTLTVLGQFTLQTKLN